MERTHFIRTIEREQFKKLRRRFNVGQRSGLAVNQEEYLEMLNLDDYLSLNDSQWHRNYEESAYIGEIARGKQDAESR